jgi:uncharacterized membrane protein YphA (DoxX/SURF4 family)
MNVTLILTWVGKFGVCLFFIVSGIDHLMNLQAMTARVQEKKVPMASAAVVLTSLMMLAGSAMVLVRWHALWGSSLLILYAAPAAFVMHNFWAETDAAARTNALGHFLKNLGLCAGVGLLAVGVHRGMW